MGDEAVIIDESELELGLITEITHKFQRWVLHRFTVDSGGTLGKRD